MSTSASKSKKLSLPVLTKPFLKWVGGKTQILETVLEHFPTDINNYFEPFLGGGSVLFGLLSYIRSGFIRLHGSIYVSDINPYLINLYENIKQNPDLVISEINHLIEEFQSCPTDDKAIVNRNAKTKDEAMTSQESYYYWIRSQYNSLPSEEHKSSLAAAMLLFLNKTCFRGVYREGPHGFNVPFGHYKNPSIFEVEHIKEISEMIKDVVFRTSDFSEILDELEVGDFVYLDPPYAPETSKSFVSYTSDGFTIDQHQTLFRKCNEIAEKKIKLLLSNAEVDLVKTAFNEPLFKTKIIECRRAIHSKKPDSKTNEVLVYNP